MFKFDEIRELIELVGSSGVSSVEVEHAGSRLRIEGRRRSWWPHHRPSQPSRHLVPARCCERRIARRRRRARSRRGGGRSSQDQLADRRHLLPGAEPRRRSVRQGRGFHRARPDPLHRRSHEVDERDRVRHQRDDRQGAASKRPTRGVRRTALPDPSGVTAGNRCFRRS